MCVNRGHLLLLDHVLRPPCQVDHAADRANLHWASRSLVPRVSARYLPTKLVSATFSIGVAVAASADIPRPVA